MIFLNDSMVESLIDYPAMVDELETAFLDLAHGDAAVQLRERTGVGKEKLSTLGAILGPDHVAAAKVYATSPTGRFGFVVLLFDTEEGVPLAVMEGGALTRIRTAATSILCGRLMGAPESGTVTVFGTGVQAETHIEALARCSHPDRIWVVARRPVRDWARTLESRCGVEVTQTEDIGAALEESNQIVTATRSTRPLFPSDAVKPGTHITAVGSTKPDAWELEPALIGRSRIVVENLEQARTEAGDLINAFEHGELKWQDVREIADLLPDGPTRPHSSEITLFESLGIGLEDTAAAALAYRRAIQEGAGMELESSPWAG